MNKNKKIPSVPKKFLIHTILSYLQSSRISHKNYENNW